MEEENILRQARELEKGLLEVNLFLALMGTVIGDELNDRSCESINESR